MFDIFYDLMIEGTDALEEEEEEAFMGIYDDAAKAIKIFGQYFLLLHENCKNLHLEHLYQQYFLAAVGAADLSPLADRCYYPGRLLLSACY